MDDYERLGYQRYAEENRDEVELMKKKALESKLRDRRRMNISMITTFNKANSPGRRSEQ